MSGKLASRLSSKYFFICTFWFVYEYLLNVTFLQGSKCSSKGDASPNFFTLRLYNKTMTATSISK